VCDYTKGATMTKQENRTNYPMPESEMYNISDINQFIEKERRHDELDRLREVRQQKKVWISVVGISAVVNSIFLLLAFMGE
tara:strand:- start:27 stop:269 length:243 start_codon:yes stop_codon:yes gene_type:complete